MKRRMLAGVLSLVAVSAMAADAAPKLYGKLNKDVKYITQEDAAQAKEFVGPRDIESSESRLGVKGAYEIGALNAGYRLEVGLNSARVNKPEAGSTYQANTSERIRIRDAAVELGGEYGTVRFGQYYLQNALRFQKLDPFQGTSAGFYQNSNDDVVGYASGYAGVYGRSRPESISYSTPVMGGFQLDLAMDQGDSTETAKSADREEWKTLTAMYDTELAGGNLSVTAAYAMQDKARLTTTEDDETYWQVGAMFSMADMMFSAGYGVRENIANAKENSDATDMFITAAYNVNADMKVALTYGQTDVDSAVTLASGTGGTQTQIATGMIYKLSDMVKWNVNLMQQKVEVDAGTVVGTQKDNTATVLLTGMTLDF